MAVHLGVRGPAHVARIGTTSGGGGGGAPAWLSSFTITGDLTVNNTQTGTAKHYVNGMVAIVVTNLGAYSSGDPSKCRIRVRDYGWDTSGNAVERTRYIYGTQRMELSDPDYGTYVDTQYAAGTFIFGLTQKLYNDTQSDSTLRVYATMIDDIEFTSGFYNGSTAGTYTGSVTRNDSFPYPKPLVKQVEAPYRVVGASGILSIGYAAIHEFARDGQQLACVEAWLRQSSVDGAISRASSMTECVYTSDHLAPSGFTGSEFRCAPAVHGSHVDGEALVRSTFKPFIGPKWNSHSDGVTPSLGDDWFAGQHPNLMREFPVELDLTGVKYSYLNLWVNQDPTVGLTSASLAGVNMPGVTTDPGSALSYTTIAQALAAGQSANNSATYRPGKTHNDRDALCIWLRDVPGSVGDNATAYSTGGAAISGTVVRIPPMIRSVSGAASTAVRMRGYSPAGVAHSTANKTVSVTKIHFKGIWFDGTNSSQTTADGSVVVWGGSSTSTPPAITNGSEAVFSVFEDCYSDSHSATASTKALSQTRIMYFYRCNINNNATDMRAIAFSSLSGQVCAIGSKFTNTSVDGLLALGTFVLGSGTLVFGQSNAAPTQQAVKAYIVHNCRFDATAGAPSLGTTPASAARAFAQHGVGFDGFVIGRYNTLGQALFQAGADNQMIAFRNYVFQHMSFAGGQTIADENQARCNMFYNDNLYIAIERYGGYRFVSFATHSLKYAEYSTAGGFPGPGGLAYSALTKYYQGDPTWDGTTGGGTPATGATCYQCIHDNVAIGTPLSDTTAFFNLGTPGTAQAGVQGRRLGDKAVRMSANCWGSMSGGVAEGAGQLHVCGAHELMGDIPVPGAGTNGSGSKWGFQTNNTRFVSDLSGGGQSANIGLGDFRPNASGDLMGARQNDPNNPFDHACSPYDMLATARNLSAAGPCGALEA